MIVSLVLLLACQLLGEAAARGAGLPVPGPVIGIALLLAVLAWREHRSRAVPAELADGTFDGTAKGLLSHLSLLFVPAGVGVVQQLDVLLAHGLGLAVALAVSTVAALATTAGTFVLVTRLLGPADDQEGEA